ncbi:hypothetical protein GQ464_018355 [Rhodocaloribacter litoris]|uniref:hypothetical protein n=1 Tax=Rhodocaloribacter litoris TaxID=2558931 RepID=UPI00141F802C|nr:hypothetical protein [Rhodocaloribacter litoris]QXD15328.1 hypothetical protein GQ464_018355 [Rhodocaloribacter litoris]GIV62341.1 MAG: hypothetical protein KatS3mg044_1207 [Rhodothermaceae bacterium]
MRTLRWTLLFLIGWLVTVPATARQHDHDPDEAVTGGGHLPEGWQARLDRARASLDQVRFVETEAGYHITLGPAAIFYRPEDTASGSYTARATFVLNKPSAHPEAYGLFVGGRDLNGPGQDYLYFLVRQNGQYLVKHRAGAETHTLVDWTPHEAVRVPGERGTSENTLAVRATPERVAFLVNGVEVTALDRVPMLNTDGIAGLRVNHNLDVTVRDFAIER